VFLLAWYVPKLISVVPGSLADRYGARWLATTGFVASIPSLIALSFIKQGSDRNRVLFIIFSICLSITMCFANTPISAEVIYAVDDKERENPVLFPPSGAAGLAFGLNVFAWSLGATVGSLLSAFLVDSIGWSGTLYTLCAWCVIGAVVCSLWSGPAPEERLRRELNRKADANPDPIGQVEATAAQYGEMAASPVEYEHPDMWPRSPASPSHSAPARAVADQQWQRKESVSRTLSRSLSHSTRRRTG
jgi:MFS family permease